MADFSKQWCEENNLEISGDFDILEEADKLDPNSYIDIICEGFGFNAISKDSNGNVLLSFHNDQDGITEWKPYNKIIK
jgi:hypothetical protein